MTRGDIAVPTPVPAPEGPASAGAFLGLGVGAPALIALVVFDRMLALGCITELLESGESASAAVVWGDSGIC